MSPWAAPGWSRGFSVTAPGRQWRRRAFSKTLHQSRTGSAPLLANIAVVPVEPIAAIIRDPGSREGALVTCEGRLGRKLFCNPFRASSGACGSQFIPGVNRHWPCGGRRPWRGRFCQASNWEPNRGCRRRGAAARRACLLSCHGGARLMSPHKHLWTKI
jgi:hypothetical protein